jgi:hypothetical protein
MPTWKDVTTIALALPQTEVSMWYGTPGVKVAGKGFLRWRTESEGGVMMLCDPDKKASLLRLSNPAYFTTPHYDGFGAILVDLKKVKRADLVDLITEAWRRQAPMRLLTTFDAASGTSAPSARARSGTRRKRSGRDPVGRSVSRHRSD